MDQNYGSFMSKYNAFLKYKPISAKENEDGFWQEVTTRWVDAGICRVEKQLPAKQVSGQDGALITYTYVIYIPKDDSCTLEEGSPLMLLLDTGQVVQNIKVSCCNQLNNDHLIVWA